MMTPGEIQATGTALESLASEVDAARAAYGHARNWLSYLGVEDEITRNAREAFEVKLGLYNALMDARNLLAEAPDYDHEQALMIVDTARRSVGLNTAEAIAAMADANDPLMIAARAAVQTAQQAGDLLRVVVPAVLVIVAVIVVTSRE